ncbi:MAG: MBL fold metallo-hydrolase [Chitinivibrionales bacterium]|nr:MBL fold metallo-hydrolase [Chitinivibrionales bacterium]
MKVTFAGGAGSIGASCALLESQGSALVVDCGIRMGEGKSPLPDLAVLDGIVPEAIVVTHAHTDHSGALPLLAASFPQAPIVTTPPGIDLITILLNDSLKLMNSPEREGDIPLFTREQLEQTFRAFVPLHQGEARRFGPFSCTFYPAGHILGASMLHVTTPDGHVLFTGDYSGGMQRTVGAVVRPTLPVDLLITESTYGARLHEDRKAAESRLIAQLKEVVQRGGRVLIPCFAVGRAQEILLILRTAMRNGRLEPVPVFVDGMVRSVCNVYAKHERYVTRGLAHDIRAQAHPFFTDTIEPIHADQDRQRALQQRPAIYVASSGMLSGGASVVYAKELLRNPLDAVLLTGYQDEEAPGRRLLALAEESETTRTISLQGETVDVKASVELFGLSAHADRFMMTALIESCRPRTVVLVHGDAASQQALHDALSIPDKVCGHDGLVVERTYPLRDAPSTSEHYDLPREADIARVRALLGPPSSSALKAGAVAQAWFGRKASADLIEKLVERLIALDLVRRHDEKRNLIHVLRPDESDALTDEAERVQSVVQQNPKGKLLEHCMRVKAAFPTTEFAVDGAYHTASMTLALDGSVLESGVHRAADKSSAEQLAAGALLTRVEQASLSAITGDIIDVNEELSQSLKAANPKGRLLECCAQRSAPAPRFESQVIAGSWCCRVTVELGGVRVCSDWYRDHNRKTAEQAAAAQVLERIAEPEPSGETHPQGPPPNVGAVGHADSTGSTHISDPYASLIALKQRGYLTDYGFEHLGGSGPPHAPVFQCAAWATLDSGERVESLAEGGSKKGAQRAAAEGLVARVTDSM